MQSKAHQEYRQTYTTAIGSLFTAIALLHTQLHPSRNLPTHWLANSTYALNTSTSHYQQTIASTTTKSSTRSVIETAIQAHDITRDAQKSGFEDDVDVVMDDLKLLEGLPRVLRCGHGDEGRQMCMFREVHELIERKGRVIEGIRKREREEREERERREEEMREEEERKEESMRTGTNGKK
ncbi:MAG: hypothetical protein Q9168_003543 [Polycauliona sp. 1 TL-2023]